MRRLLREPLVHFLALGAGLFLLFAWRGTAGSDSGRIVVSQARVSRLATGFARTWQRQPTPQELNGLVQDFVREEVCVREARKMGLDRDDTIIRRRLRQKFEFLTEDAVEVATPTDADLAAWLKAHPDSFRGEPGRAPGLSEVREAVAREWEAARRKERSEAFFRELLERYEVSVEPVENEARPAAKGGKAR